MKSIDSEKYPYCIVGDVLDFPGEENPERRETMRRRIAAGIGDVDALARILGVEPEEFADFYGDAGAPTLSTEDTIDSFLDKFGPRTGAGVDPLAVAPAVDYATMLEIEERQSAAGENVAAASTEVVNSKMSEPETASEALSGSSDAAAGGSAKEAKGAEDTSLSESFARILIKNRKYSKALEIISQLSLNNPEKSVYFADQIRFLRKVVYNEIKSKK